MGRYLCQLCWSIVHYGERHPCFFYRDDEEVYTVPPPNEPEEMEGKREETEGANPANSNENHGQIRSTAERKDFEEPNETNSSLIENKGRISLMPASRRKRSPFSLMPSKCLRERENGPSVSIPASSTHAERDGSKDAAKKTKMDRKIESPSAVVPEVGNGSTSEMAPSSAAFGPVSDADAGFVAGPSGVQTQPHRTGKEKRFVCDVCGKAFSRRNNLQDHMRTHTGDRPFVCSTCGRGFTIQGHLTRHVRTHTGEKPFECDECGRGFAQKNQLTRHLQTHTEEKPFKCAFCGKEYADKRTCDDHQKRKHGGME